MKLLKNKLFVIFLVIGLVVAFGFFVAGMFENLFGREVVRIETSEGDIFVELYKDKAPITVENFLSYVDEGFYDGTTFHRVIEGFMVQGGGFTKDGTQKETNEPIKLESDNGLKNEAGMVAMARTPVADSATSQFFINTADNDFLNYGVRDEGYAVFGRVVEGMEVVEKIERVATDSRDKPLEEIIIMKIERV